MQNAFKRAFYIEQLRQLNITEVDGVPLQKMTDRELNFVLAMARIKRGA